MSDYYVSPDGNDSNEGTHLGSPLRTISRAVELIAEAYVDRGNVAVPEFVHLEPGLYSRESGEIFPIIIPTLTEVQGSSADDCIIEYSPGEGPFACGYSDTCIELHGSLMDVTITSEFPPGAVFPVIDVRLMDEHAILENAACDFVYVNAATRVSQVNFEGVLMTRDGFERDGEIFPLIYDCHNTHTWPYNSAMGFQIWGGRVERCSGIVFWINSPGRTVIQNNDIPLIRGFIVHRPVNDTAADSDDMIPKILYNNIQSIDTLSDNDVQGAANHVGVFGESYWEGNTIYIRRMYICSSCEFSNNRIGAFRVDIEWSGPWDYEPLGPGGYEIRINCPEFSYNIFEQVYHRDILRIGDQGDGPEAESFLTITAEACPIFEHNEFQMRETETLTPVFIQKYVVPERADPILADIITGLPNPDFGGGGFSTGGNLFHVSTPGTPHIKIDMGTETFHLKAEDNIWSYDPNIEVIGEGTGVSYDLGEVTLE